MVSATFPEDFGANLRSRRKAAGYSSFKDFANHIGMSPSRYYEYEKGRRNVTVEDASTFADALGCSLADLTGMSTPASPTYTVDEVDLIELYRSMDKTAQYLLMQLSRYLAEKAV